MDNIKTVMITGSNRGIGKATLEYFASKGWDVVAHSRRYSKEFEDCINEIEQKFKVKVTPIYFDMCDKMEMKSQIKDIIIKPKMKIDALINNAGVAEITLFMLTSVDRIREVFEVNLFSHMELTRLILPRMQRGSSIVNVSSCDSFSPNKGHSAYATSKAAMNVWTNVLQQELIGRIRVNAVAPCAVLTDMTKAVKDRVAWKGHEDELLKIENVVSTIYFLASEEAEGITGETIKIRGPQVY